MNKMHTLLLATFLVAGAPLAQADAADAPPTAVVRFADLDLSSLQGAAALFSRLHGAAERVCQPLNGREPERTVRYKDCVVLALANAVTRIDRPALSAYAAAQRREKGTASTLVVRQP